MSASKPRDEIPEYILADALREEIKFHRAGEYDRIGEAFDDVESAVLPFWGTASDRFHLAWRFWDGWIDARNHDWLFYEGIASADWPNLADEVIRSLESEEPVTYPKLLAYFGPKTRTGLIGRLGEMVHRLRRRSDGDTSS